MKGIQPLDLSATTALLGAGVSVESGVPSALPLMESIIRSLVHSRWARDRLIQETIRRHSRGNYDYLRFEQLLEWVSEVFDEDLEVLSFLDHITEPSRIHRAMARATSNGLVITTVNFDDLLEQAIESDGGTPITVDAHGSMSGDTLTGTHVIKLHGSRRWHGVDGGHNPPHATIGRIAAANPGLTLGDNASSALQSAINRRTLVVCGYSGSDDLDIVPALGASTPDRVVWFSFSSDEPRKLAEPEWRRSGESWIELLEDWIRAGVSVDVVGGDTAHALEYIGFDGPPTNSIQQIDWETEIREWADGVQWKDPTGLGFAGIVLGDLERGSVSVRALEESESTEEPGATWTPHRRLYELAQAVLLQTPSDPVRARPIALDSLKAAEAAGSQSDELYARLLLGRIEFILDPHDATTALLHFQEAIGLGRPDTLDWAFAAERTANVLARSGEPLEAIRLAWQAVAIFRREGLVSSEIDALMVLATAQTDVGDWDAANQNLDLAEATATTLGYPERTFEVMALRASHAFDLGNLDEAESWALRALGSLSGETHDEAALAHATLGQVDRERHQYARSVAHFQAAIGACSTVTRAHVLGLRIDLAESMLLDHDIEGAVATIDEIERDGEFANAAPWISRTLNAALRHGASASRDDAARVSALLRSRPPGVPARSAAKFGMSLGRLGVNEPGIRLNLYRAEQAARGLGAMDRASYLQSARIRCHTSGSTT